MRLLLLILGLGLSLHAESITKLQAYSDLWAGRFDMTIKPEVHKVPAKQLLLLCGTIEADSCYGFSAMFKDGRIKIWVLDESGYPEINELSQRDLKKKSAINADQRDTVLHELIHMMIAVGNEGDNLEEHVVDSFSRWLGKVK